MTKGAAIPVPAGKVEVDFAELTVIARGGIPPKGT